MMKLTQTTLNHIACIVGSTYRVVSTLYDQVNALAVCIKVNDDKTSAKYIVTKRYGGKYSVGETFNLTTENYNNYTTFSRVLPHELKVFYDNLGTTLEDMKGSEQE